MQAVLPILNSCCTLTALKYSILCRIVIGIFVFCNIFNAVCMAIPCKKPFVFDIDMYSHAIIECSIKQPRILQKLIKVNQNVRAHRLHRLMHYSSIPKKYRMQYFIPTSYYIVLQHKTGLYNLN